MDSKRVLIPVLLLLALVAGPSLQVLAASDWNIKRWPGGSQQVLSVLNAYPFGFFLVSLIAYTFAIRPPRTMEDVNRAAAAVLCGICLQGVLLVLSLPLLFGLGDGGSRQMVVIGLSVLGAMHALVVGTVHHLVLRSRVPALLEISAHVLCASLPVAILDYAVPGIDSAPRLQLFGAWPALLALIPYLLLILAYAPRSIGFSTAFYAVALSALMPYGVKAIADYRSPRGQALAWPYRVVTTFETPRSSNARMDAYLQRLRAGEAFQLGNERFRVEKGLQAVHTRDQTPDTFVTSFQVMVPAETLQLTPKFDLARFISLTVSRGDIGEVRRSDAFHLNGQTGELRYSLQRAGAKVDYDDSELHSRVLAVIDSLKVQ